VSICEYMYTLCNDPRALWMLGKHSTTELHLQPNFLRFAVKVF
jgi:hypothetical protein